MTSIDMRVVDRAIAAGEEAYALHLGYPRRKVLSIEDRRSVRTVILAASDPLVDRGRREVLAASEPLAAAVEAKLFGNGSTRAVEEAWVAYADAVLKLEGK